LLVVGVEEAGQAEGRGIAGADVVDEDVDAAQFRHRRRDDGLGSLASGQVSGHGHGGRRVQFRGNRACGSDHTHPFLRECFSDGQADAAAGSCHDSGFVGE